MPYLSWYEGPQLRRERLDGVRILGSDPQRSTLVGPVGSPPAQAVIQPEGAHWRLRPLEGAVIRREGEMLPAAGILLEDGDAVSLGTWETRFSSRFPGLDLERFLETSGPLPLPSGAAAAAPLRWIAGLAQRLEQGLLAQEDPTALAQRLLEEACSFLAADGALHLRQAAQAPWRPVHRVGLPLEDREPAHSLVSHALKDRVSLFSNDPWLDPRAVAASPGGPVMGPILVAPVLLDDDSEEGAEGAFVLFRRPGGLGFMAPDLSLLRSAADLASLAHRLSLVQRRFLSQAELESQLIHLRRELERQDDRQGHLLASLGGSISRSRALLRRMEGPSALALERQMAGMSRLVGEGQSTDPGLAPPPGRARSLAEIQRDILEAWGAFAEALDLTVQSQPAPEAEVWLGGGPVMDALHSLLDELFLHLPGGSSIPIQWREEPGHWLLDFELPSGIGRVSPDAWSRGVLAGAGLDWRWRDGRLSLVFREAPGLELTAPERPMLGLATEDLGLMALFQGAADAGDLSLFPLEEDPPAPPLPLFEVVVVDARGVRDVVACLRAYRAHPSFATTPVLVVRARELDGPELLAAGATDWLADALRWESLHHRLQSLRRHRDLQRKGRASERLETVRQMAGTLKHEINNPLAVISLQNELLQRKYPDEPKLAKIAEQVQRIQSLMQVLQQMREPGDEDYPGGTNILKL
ncbi:MAG TPA: histidine kinase dimerization/phospho-acceptor domain-containing protein [Holophagaceae bacterium]|nr:histidine kinase dimerization/phospho-acceptor domain-containing protein [Holophagaceae bacterium]